MVGIAGIRTIRRADVGPPCPVPKVAGQAEPQRHDAAADIFGGSQPARTRSMNPCRSRIRSARRSRCRNAQPFLRRICGWSAGAEPVSDLRAPSRIPSNSSLPRSSSPYCATALRRADIRPAMSRSDGSGSDASVTPAALVTSCSGSEKILYERRNHIWCLGLTLPDHQDFPPVIQ